MSFAVLIVGTLLLLWLAYRWRAASMLVSRKKAHRTALERAKLVLDQLRRPSDEASFDLSSFPDELRAPVGEKLPLLATHVARLGDDAYLGDEAAMREVAAAFHFVRRALTDGFSSSELEELRAKQLSASSTPRT